jgi:hypothetical protein
VCTKVVDSPRQKESPAALPDARAVTRKGALAVQDEADSSPERKYDAESRI